MNIWNVEAVQFNQKFRFTRKKKTKYFDSSMPNGKWTTRVQFHPNTSKTKNCPDSRQQQSSKINLYIIKWVHRTFRIYSTSQKCCYVRNHLWFDVKWAKVCFMSNFRHPFWLIFSHFFSHRFTYREYCSHAENLSSSTTWYSFGNWNSYFHVFIGIQFARVNSKYLWMHFSEYTVSDWNWNVRK